MLHSSERYSKSMQTRLCTFYYFPQLERSQTVKKQSETVFEYNRRDVYRKNVVNNVDMSRLRAT